MLRLLAVDARLEVLLHALSEGQSLLGALGLATREGAEGVFALCGLELEFVALCELLGEVEELLEARDVRSVCVSAVSGLLFSG